MAALGAIVRCSQAQFRSCLGPLSNKTRSCAAVLDAMPARVRIATIPILEWDPFLHHGDRAIALELTMDGSAAAMCKRVPGFSAFGSGIRRDTKLGAGFGRQPSGEPISIR